MNFDGDFIKLGKLDIADLKEHVLQYSEEDWNRNNARQKKFEAHKDTATIQLIFDDDFRHTNPTALPEYYKIEPLLKPVYRLIRKYYNKSLKYKRLQDKNGRAYPVRTILTRLRPGGVIPEHMDRNFTLSHGHRIHIPIITDNDVEFSVGGNVEKFNEGDVWEINNRHAHYVKNDSTIHRIHLIVDWVIPGERCCCGTKANPKGTCSPENCHPFDFRGAPCDCFG